MSHGLRLLFFFVSHTNVVTMILVDVLFRHGGEWITKPNVLYSRKPVHKWKDDNGIRTLLSFVNDQFDVINLFAIEDSELAVDVENIGIHKETLIDVDDAATDCYSGSDSSSEDGSDCSDYVDEELEALAKEKNSAYNVQTENSLQVQTQNSNFNKEQGEQIVTNITELYQNQEQHAVNQMNMANMNQSRACVFIRNQYERILQMLNQTGGLSHASANVTKADIGGNDTTDSQNRYQIHNPEDDIQQEDQKEVNRVEDELMRTPTSKESRIQMICPPAPKKPKSSVLTVTKRKRKMYFDIHDEVELLFPPALLTDLIKKIRTTTSTIL
ncbi:hypothetical protein K7X08_003592 [Anisodus acutangulus]|uniref:Uncharacterized protein n=1 Tax=Anisodus acutangulus TaxID=402998 RepID=A0A9Q1MH87_9SOLA|nr:hypothetical protein K7X08_003592 [Anisodus acutangulus]